jgi:hypothetical protein
MVSQWMPGELAAFLGFGVSLTTWRPGGYQRWAAAGSSKVFTIEWAARTR